MNRSLEELPVSGDVVLYSFPKCGRTWVRTCTCTFSVSTLRRHT